MKYQQSEDENEKGKKGTRPAFSRGTKDLFLRIIRSRYIFSNTDRVSPNRFKRFSNFAKNAVARNNRHISGFLNTILTSREGSESVQRRDFYDWTRARPLSYSKLGQSPTEISIRNQDLPIVSPNRFKRFSNFAKNAVARNSSVPIRSGTNINIHVGSFATELTRHLGADAVTLGRDIFFAKGKYHPTTSSGIGLLVHELTHVKQQEKNPYLLKSGLSQYALMEKEALTNEHYTLEFFSKHQNILNRYHERPTTHFGPVSTGMTGVVSKTDLGPSDTLLIKPAFESQSNNGLESSFGGGVHLYRMGRLGIDSFLSDRLANLSSKLRYPTYDSSDSYANRANTQTENISLLNYGKEIMSHMSSSRHRSTVVPLMAKTTRSLPAAASPDDSTPAQPGIPKSSSATQPDIERLAERVYLLLERDIKNRRNQRGIR